MLPVWRRSWNRKPSASPASATHSAQRADRWKLFRRNAAPFGALKIKSSGSLGGNSARCSGAAIANARPLYFAASVLTCPAYEFVRVRSRRALVTACPYPSLLK